MTLTQNNDYDRIHHFIDELNSNISRNYERINDIYIQSYNYPELDPLRDEICNCIICGLNQAAITLTNHLLEASLKKCLAMRYSLVNKEENIELKDTFRNGIEKYDSKNLWETIDQASKQDLITNKQKELLLKFKDEFRNSYSHATSANIFDDKKVKSAFVSLQEGENSEDLLRRVFTTETNEMVLIKDFLPVQGIAQVIIAKKYAVSYFTEVDKIISDILMNIKPNI